MALLRRRIPNCCEHDPKLTCDLHEFKSWEDLYDLGFPENKHPACEYLLADPIPMGFDYKFKGYQSQKVLVYRVPMDVNMESRPDYPPRYEFVKPVAIIFDCTDLEKLDIKDYIPITELKEGNKNE